MPSERGLRDLLERVPWKARRMIKGIFPMKKDRQLGLFNLEKRRLRGDLVNVYKYLRGRCQEDEANPFPVVPSNTRNNGFKLEHRKFHLSMGGKFTVRVMEPWHRLPREVLESPLETFKAYLDVSCVGCFGHPALAEGLDQMISRGIF